MADYVSLDPPHALRRSSSSGEHGLTNPVACTRAEHDRIAGIASQYRKITGGASASTDIVEMDAGEKAAVDAAAVVAADDSEMSSLQLRNALTAFALLVLDELNTQAATVTAILDAADGASNLASFKSAMAGISDLPQRTAAQLRAAIRTKMETL